MITDTTERGLERQICKALTGSPCDPNASRVVRESSDSYGGGWICGRPGDYDREYCIDRGQLEAFLNQTQPETAEALALKADGPSRHKFLTRLHNEIRKRGVIDVFRKGVRHGPHNVEFFYGTPSPGNKEAQESYEANRFSVTRQLRYSQEQKGLALDLALFINGLPVVTFELKNSLTKQTANDAVQQYRRRNPKEKIFELGRCVAHFAVDENEAQFCTHLRGEDSWFLPFNRGWKDGGGNPPNPGGFKTAYLWRQVLSRESLTDILENYAQRAVEQSARGRKTQIWPRYHQLDAVNKLLTDALENGVGRRYLIQHSAGSGKSYSIAWLAHRLIGLANGNTPVFDSVIVVTDRLILDRQICDTIKQFAQVGATVGHAKRSGDLRRFIQSGKKIIISTVQKFPFILDEIDKQPKGRTFAIIIDEAHSSQGGRQAAAMSQALSEAGENDGDGDEDDTFEDRINRIMEARNMLSNASYFAFTATPKNKTLEIFGTPDPQPDGTVKHIPFHVYTMKQAIQEGFILDVLRHYTPVESFYKLIKTVDTDPVFDTKKAGGKLRRYVEQHDHAIRLKAEIMVDHFHEHVLAKCKIGGQARAMVVTDGVERAIRYYHAISSYLTARKSQHRAIVAFSGERKYQGSRVTEASLNGFPSLKIATKIREHPYRFLICADKFQTGYDEPLLHTMYVDKILSGVKAVQTLSRLNRAHPKKHGVFILDFANDVDVIREAFEPYYRATILSDETDPDKLHDLQATLDGYEVYSNETVDSFVRAFLDGADREQLDPILDKCVAVYLNDLGEDHQVDFKGKAKAFLRTYDFLSAILPYNYAEWEKRSIFLHLLVPKLPAPIEEDLSRGILETIDMDSFRIEKHTAMHIKMSADNSEIDPVPVSGGAHMTELELDTLSAILLEFNDQWGNIAWTDKDRTWRTITEDIPVKLMEDKALRNALKNADSQNIRIEHDNALVRAMYSVLESDMELFKKFTDDDSFKRWLADMVFRLTSQHRSAQG